MVASIRIDIISDVVCPWCFIGYRQLERALAIAGLAGDIRWHPFELNPDMPREGADMAEHFREKGMPPERLAAASAHLREMGASLGIDFTHRSKRVWNTFDAHRLLHWARDSGRQTALQLLLFEAYFTRGENVSDPQVLLAAVESAGLDRAEAAAVLAGDAEAAAVRALEGRWRQLGISGVPAMIVAERALITGAQEADRLAVALGKLAAEVAKEAEAAGAA